MHYKARILEEKIAELFSYYPVVAVLGARQVGKSTLVENLFKDKIQTIVFDPVMDMGNARRDPDFFLQNIRPPAFLDEIQYAPELLNSIKRFVDDQKMNSLYILSGSQNLSILKDISESLAGRVAIINLMPMTRGEIQESTGPSFITEWLRTGGSEYAGSARPEPVFPYIWRGSYPKITELPDHMIPGYWESYMQTYIERDVRRVANITSLQAFGDLVGLLGAYSAQEINFNQVGREIGVDRKTARAWTDIAVATYQWFEIPPFSRNAVKKIAGKRKGYFSDTGFLCYLQRISTPEVIARHPLKGALFETYVVMEIMKNLQPLPIKPNLYHYRSYAGAEVDLILELDGILYPIEIKAKSNPGGRDIKGFRSFRECFPNETIQTGLVICSIEAPRMLSEDVLAIPWWVV